jgi:hypothetical protein
MALRDADFDIDAWRAALLDKSLDELVSWASHKPGASAAS